MRVAVTLIDRILRSDVTEDGKHAVVTLSDVDDQLVTLGIPCGQLMGLINASARALNESYRVQRQDVSSTEFVGVTWWTLHTDKASGNLLLSLTFGTGGSLCFALPPEMAKALSNDLSARLAFSQAAEAHGFGVFTSDSGDAPLPVGAASSDE